MVEAFEGLNEMFLEGNEFENPEFDKQVRDALNQLKPYLNNLANLF